MKALMIMLSVGTVCAFVQEEYTAMTLCGLGAWLLEGMID